MAYYSESKEQNPLVKKVKNAMDRYENDHNYIDNIIENILHKNVKSVSIDCDTGKAIVDKSEWLDYCDELSDEICPAQVKRQEVYKKLKKLRYADSSDFTSFHLDLNFEYGGKTFLGGLFVMSQKRGNKIGIIYGYYKYSWNEQKDWKLNKSVWLTSQRKTQLQNFLKFK
eukprot:762250_1